MILPSPFQWLCSSGATFSLDPADFYDTIEFSVVYETRRLQEVISLVLLNLIDPTSSKALQFSQNPVTKNFLLYPFLKLTVSPVCNHIVPQKSKTKQKTPDSSCLASVPLSYRIILHTQSIFHSAFKNVCGGL